MNFGTIVSFLGGGTVILYIVLALVAPGLLNTLTPIVTAIVKAISGLVAYLWGAFLYISKDVSSLVLIAFIIAGTHYYTYYKEKPVIIKQLHKHYRFIPKQKETNPIFTNPLDWWNRV